MAYADTACHRDGYAPMNVSCRIVNTHIRGSLHDRDITDKQQGNCLKYGHVLRIPAEYVGSKSYTVTSLGTGIRGRPWQRWLDIVGQEMCANGFQIMAKIVQSGRAK